MQQLEASALREAALTRLRIVTHLRETLQNKFSSVSLPQMKHVIDTGHNQGLLDTEHRIALQPLIAFWVPSARELPEPWSLDHHVQVVRPHVVPARGKKQVADRTLPVMSASTSHRLGALDVRLLGSDTRREPQHGSQSGRPCLHGRALCNPACHAPRTAYRRNLRASSVSKEDYEDGARGGQIPTVAVRFPGLDRRVRDGRPIRAQNAAFDVHVVALVLGRDRVAVLDCGGARRELLCMRNEVRALTIGRVVRVERPEHAAFRSAVDRRVVDRVDQGRDTQDVRE